MSCGSLTHVIGTISNQVYTIDPLANLPGSHYTESLPNFITGGNNINCPMTCSQVPIKLGDNDGSTY